MSDVQTMADVPTMASVHTIAEATPESLLAMPDGVDFELVGGRLMERNMGWESSRIGLCVGWLLKSHCAANDLGWVAGADAGYQCFPDDPGKVRKPDVSFIQLDRLAAGEQPTGHCRIAPDLAVEVVSPNDLYHEVETKVDEYHAAGTALVWVVNPVQRTVRVDRADGTTTLLRESDTLTGENVLPGFACPVSEIFRQPGQRA